MSAARRFNLKYGHLFRRMRKFVPRRWGAIRKSAARTGRSMRFTDYGGIYT